MLSMLSVSLCTVQKRFLQAINWMLQYLKGTPRKGILLLEAYTCANYVGSLVDKRSTTRHCAFLGRNLEVWKSKKQNVVARSSAEVEFRVMTQGICELLWLKIILEDLKIKWNGPMRSTNMTGQST